MRWARRDSTLAPMVIPAFLSILAFLFAMPLAAQTDPTSSLTYAVRLFWKQVPAAIEIAPPMPFQPTTAPALLLQDGRKLMLRGPLLVAVDGERLRLGDRFSNHATGVEVSGRLRLRIPGGSWSDLPGRLRVWVEDGELQAETVLEREDYVRLVLAGEAGGISEPEALKAIAVAIRSYAFTLSNRHEQEGFHFCDTTHCQDLRLRSGGRTVDAAVQATEGELLWREGAPVRAWHHANSGGHTEDARAVWGAEAPAWMRGKADPWSEKQTTTRWTARLRTQDIERALAAEGYPARAALQPRVLSHLRSGRVERIHVGRRTLPASTFRFAIGRQLGWNHLRSDLYSMYDDGESIRFEGKGAGHGVGLSQVGAQAMARAGRGYREILAFYYEGARVGIQAADIPWTLRSAGSTRFYFAASAVDERFPALVEQELRRMESATGFRLTGSLTIRVYPDLDTFRNHSANAGWIAAGARATSSGTEIAFQPLDRLRRSNTLHLLVRHELAHVLVMQNASTELPRWFHEGLAHWLAQGGAAPARAIKMNGFGSFRELDNALLHPSLGRYDEAAALAKKLVRNAVHAHGADRVLGWVRNGPPENDDVLLRVLQQPGQP